MAAGQDARVLLPGFPAIVAGVRDPSTIKLSDLFAEDAEQSSFGGGESILNPAGYRAGITSQLVLPHAHDLPAQRS